MLKVITFIFNVFFKFTIWQIHYFKVLNQYYHIVWNKLSSYLFDK